MMGSKLTFAQRTPVLIHYLRQGWRKLHWKINNSRLNENNTAKESESVHLHY